MFKFLIIIHRYFKLLGIRKAQKAIETATNLNKIRTENLVLYGPSYRKTMHFARLECGEKIALLKSEIYKSLFHF